MSWDHKTIPLNKRSCINSHLFHLSFVQEENSPGSCPHLMTSLSPTPHSLCSFHAVKSSGTTSWSSPTHSGAHSICLVLGLSHGVCAHFLSLILSFLVPLTHSRPFPRLVQAPSAIPSRPLLGLLSPEQSDPSQGPRFSSRNSLLPHHGACQLQNCGPPAYKTPQLPLKVLGMKYKSVNLFL